MSIGFRILHIAFGMSSYNNSLLELARRVLAADIELCVASHEDLSDLLRDMDVQFEHLKEDQAIADLRLRLMDDLKIAGILRRFVQLLRMSKVYRDQSIRVTEIADLVSRWEPDLLLIDMECHVAIIQTRSVQVPTVLCSRWFSVFRTGQIPPMHTALAPPDSFLESLHVRWAWTRLMIRKRWLDVRQRLSRRRFRPVRYDSNARCELQAVASEIGLSLDDVADQNHWLIPHVYRDIPVMSLTARELEFEQADDHRMHYVGPMVSDSSNYKHSEASDQYQRFINERKAIGNPLIYCAYSTFWTTDMQNIKPLLDLFSRRQDLDAVIGLGGKAGAMNVPGLPDNILVMSYAPQLEVLDDAAVAITHGGISTINEALHKNVPLIVSSAGHVDQDGCMARVVHHKVGVAASSGPIDATELESLIDELMGQCGSEIRAKTAEMQGHMREYDSNQSAVTFLRSMVKPT